MPHLDGADAHPDGPDSAAGVTRLGEMIHEFVAWAKEAVSLVGLRSLQYTKMERQSTIPQSIGLCRPTKEVSVLRRGFWIVRQLLELNRLLQRADRRNLTCTAKTTTG